MKSGESSTVIGPLTKIRGEISGTEPLLVDGELEGVIHLEGATLTVRPEGRVRANIEAQDVVVLGYVEGQIRAAGLLHLRGTAVVQGDVFAARLSIEDGATLRGKADSSRTTDVAAGQARSAEPAASHEGAVAKV